MSEVNSWWPVHSRGWLAGHLRSRKQLLSFISGLLSIAQDFGKQPRTQRFTRMNRDYSSSAVEMSQNMLTRLNRDSLNTNEVQLFNHSVLNL